jgi:hypothetical protein
VTSDSRYANFLPQISHSKGLKKKLFLFNFYRNLILSFFFRILRHANYRMGVMGDIHMHSVIFTCIV